jgi:formamidopyrimidine-DNA glycosylase
MPELPEVETIARGLLPLIHGRRIAQVEVLFSGSIQGDLRTFTQQLTGQAIQE